VVKSLEAALWAFYKTDSFREGALLAVNLGNDADITGAIYGQLAGSFYGMEGNPGRMDIQTLPEGYDPFLCRQAL
jgi:ADP-ribosylglycohydrolase